MSGRHGEACGELGVGSELMGAMGRWGKPGQPDGAGTGFVGEVREGPLCARVRFRKGLGVKPLGVWGAPRVVRGRSPRWITWLGRAAWVRPKWLGGLGLGRGFELLSLGWFRETRGCMQVVHCLAEKRFFAQGILRT